MTQNAEMTLGSLRGEGGIQRPPRPQAAFLSLVFSFNLKFFKKTVAAFFLKQTLFTQF